MVSIAGVCVGSFLATVARRWEQGWTAAFAGRSSCDECGSTLGPFELVPILGRLILRGYCRHCGARIPPDETFVEVLAGLVGLAAVLADQTGWYWLVGYGWLLVLLGAIDHLHGILPDVLNLLMLLLGGSALIFDPASPAPFDGLLGCVLGAAAFILLAFVYQRTRGRYG